MIRQISVIALAALVLTGGVWASEATGAGGNGRGAFTDDDGSVHEHDINGFAAAGITRGCNPPANDRFCPKQPVTRQEMASLCGLGLPPAGGKFVDTAGRSRCRDRRLAAAGSLSDATRRRATVSHSRDPGADSAVPGGPLI